MDARRYPIRICGIGEDCVVRLPWQESLPEDILAATGFPEEICEREISREGASETGEARERVSAGLCRNYRERAYLGELLHRLENGEKLPAAEQMDFWLGDGQTAVLQKN